MSHDHDPARREAKVKRLNRIAGQVQGVARMVAEDRYCMDVLTQVQAIKAALARAEAEILRDHAAGCVRDAIASGDAQATQAKLDELVDLFDRARR
jgi:DNA-binding FrmR family transcriptional regulator